MKGTSVIGFIRAACLLFIQEGENKQKLIFFKENKNEVAIETRLISMSSRGKRNEGQTSALGRMKKQEVSKTGQHFLYIPMRPPLNKGSVYIRANCMNSQVMCHFTCALTIQHYPSTTTTYLVLLHI